MVPSAASCNRKAGHNLVQPGATWCNREQAQKTCEDAPLSSPERAAEFSASPDCKSPTDHQHTTDLFNRFWASVNISEDTNDIPTALFGFAPE